MSEKKNNKDIKFSKNSNRELAKRGQHLSNKVESTTIGFTPLALMIINVFIAVAEAHFVSWLTPEMPWAFPKLLAFNLTGALAAIAFPSRLSFVFQTWKHKRNLKDRDSDFDDEFIAKMKKKMNTEIWRNLFLSFLLLGTIIFAHVIMIVIMGVSFTNTELVESLGIKVSAPTYLVIGIGITILSAIVDLVLGVYTQIEVDIDDFKPTFEDEKNILESSLQYSKLKYEIQRILLDVEKYSKEKEKEIEKEKKSGSSSGSSSSSGGSRSSGSSSGPGDALEPLHEIDDVSEFIEKFTDGKVTASKFNEKFNNLSNRKKGQVNQKVAQIVSDLKGQYKKGSNDETWKKEHQKIKSKLGQLRTKLKREVLSQLGITI